MEASLRLASPPSRTHTATLGSSVRRATGTSPEVPPPRIQRDLFHTRTAVKKTLVNNDVVKGLAGDLVHKCEHSEAR
jgi:hypothetical protein